MLNQEDWADLDKLSQVPGFKILVEKVLPYVKEVRFANAANAKNRTIIQKDIQIHETASEIIQFNNGYMMGAEYLIELVKSAKNNIKKE